MGKSVNNDWDLHFDVSDNIVSDGLDTVFVSLSFPYPSVVFSIATLYESVCPSVFMSHFSAFRERHTVLFLSSYFLICYTSHAAIDDRMPAR